MAWISEEEILRTNIISKALEYRMYFNTFFIIIVHSYSNVYIVAVSMIF